MNNNPISNEVNAYAYRYIRDILDCAIRDNDRDTVIDIYTALQSGSAMSISNFLTPVQKRYIINKAKDADCSIEVKLSYGKLSPLQLPKRLKCGGGTIYTFYIARHLQAMASKEPAKACAIAKKIRKDIMNNPNLAFKDKWDYLFVRLIPSNK